MGSIKFDDDFEDAYNFNRIYYSSNCNKSDNLHMEHLFKLVL